MINWVYFICDNNLKEYAKIMVESLNKHNKCKILYNCVGLGYENLQENVILHNVNIVDWRNKIQLCKIQKLKEMSKFFKENDRIFVLDVDIIIQADIFKIFDDFDFDVGITSRYYEYHYPINGGVWCLRWNENSKKFLDYFVEQILNPTWQPLINFRKNFKRGNDLNWFVDQDFLCTTYKSKLPFDCEVKNLGPMYNYCPSAPDRIPYVQAEKDLRDKFGNKEYKILHFKAIMKKLMKEI